MLIAGGSQKKKKKGKEKRVKEKWETGGQAQQCGQEEKGKNGDIEYIYLIFLIYMELEVYS